MKLLSVIIWLICGVIAYYLFQTSPVLAIIIVAFGLFVYSIIRQISKETAAKERRAAEAEPRRLKREAEEAAAKKRREEILASLDRPTSSPPANTIARTNPTAQNAYIFNMDYIRSCRSSFIAFDVETTGLKPYLDRIIEISAVRFEGFHPVAEFSTLVNPQQKIPLGASQINHIYDADVVNAPVECDAMRLFCEFIGEKALSGDDVLVAHNAEFDINFLLHALSRSGIDANIQFQDTLYMSRNFTPELPNHKLQTVAAYHGIEQVEAHRAGDDARVCGEIFVKLLQKKAAEHEAKFDAIPDEEKELCRWLKGIFSKEDLNTQLLTFQSRSYLILNCYGEVARFKTKAKKRYALIDKDASIPDGVEAVIPSKSEIDKYLRVYYSSPEDLAPLIPYYLGAYKKALAKAEAYISDSADKMRFVAKQVDGEICL